VTINIALALKASDGADKGVTPGAITMRGGRTKGGSVKRSRLTIPKLLAVSAAVALLGTGCGGPKVGTTESQAGAPGAVALGDEATISAGVSADGATPAAVSDAGGTSAAVGGGGGTKAAASGGGAGGAGGAGTQAAGTGGGAATQAAASGGSQKQAGGQAQASVGGIAGLANKAIFGGNEQCSPATGTPVSLGNVSTLSGVLGELFSPVVPALKIFVASQNACGGLNGHPIKLAIADDQGDPSTAVTQGRRLVKEGIVAFLGNIQVLTIDAMKTVVEESGVPIIGGDLTNNTWFTNPLLFPQGSPPQAISYGYHVAANEVFKKKKVGNVYCLEVPQACKEINTAFGEFDGAFPTEVVYTQQISITSPDYTSQCIEAQKAGVEVMAITNDAPTQNRWANSCAKVGHKPNYVLYPLGVGNEGQFLGNPNLGNGYVPMNHFPWMAGTDKFPGNPAMQYYQRQVAKYNPGYNAGGAASLGWQAGALLVAGSHALPPADQPVKKEDFLNGLYQFKGQDWTTLGGLTGPLVFTKGKNPFVKYCLFGAQSNAKNDGWERAITSLSCTDKRSPSDPNQKAPA
jgi:branched-chain amino acid transport system substrate-binding protein